MRPESLLGDAPPARFGEVLAWTVQGNYSCGFNVHGGAPAASGRRFKLMMSDKTRHCAGCFPACAVLTLTIALTTATGCSSTLAQWRPNEWYADYNEAEARVRESGREMLLFFHAVDQDRPDPTFRALQSESLKQQTGQHVLCSLYRSYEPDRRYAAQYGVNRAPALIVVHRDGTYHARTGVASAAQISEFLAAAEPPGAAPVLNPLIPRASNYVWYSSIESAEAAAKKTGQSILIVFDRWWPRERRKLEKLLDRSEVYSRFASMVHCRPGSVLGLDDQSMVRFGVLNLPALVVVHPDGSYQVLELPTSYEAIVRFADRARHTGGAAPSTSAAGRQ